MHRQAGNLPAQQPDRPRIAGNHRVGAGRFGLPRRREESLQLVVEGINIHRHIKPGACRVGQPDRVTQSVPVEASRVGAQPVMLHTAVYGVRAEMKRRLQRLAAPGRAKQLWDLHHSMPLLWSYCFHSGA